MAPTTSTPSTTKPRLIRRSKLVWTSALLAVPVTALLVLVRGESEPGARRDGALPEGFGHPARTAEDAPLARIAPGVHALAPAGRGPGSPQATRAVSVAGGSTPTLAPLAPQASGPEILAALRTAGDDRAREIEMQLLDEPTIPGDAAFVAGLVALARDTRANTGARAVAVDLIARASSTAEPAIDAVHELAVAREADTELRTAAVLALRQLSLERPELARPVRAALLDSLEQAPTSEARATGLDGLALAEADDSEVTRVVAWLGDADSLVRAGAARAVGSVPARRAKDVATALERALASETDLETARALVTAAVRSAGEDTAALLERLEATAIVKSSEALGRQVADYRTVLASGETDPDAILQAHEVRESERLARAGS